MVDRLTDNNRLVRPTRSISLPSTEEVYEVMALISVPTDEAKAEVATTLLAMNQQELAILRSQIEHQLYSTNGQVKVDE